MFSQHLNDIQHLLLMNQELPTVHTINKEHYSLIVTFDAKSEEKIQLAQQKLLEYGFVNALPPGKPHFTLACSNFIHTNLIGDDSLCADLKNYLKGNLILQAMGQFYIDTENCVLYISPANTNLFSSLHQAAYKLFSGYAFDSYVYYQPDRLTPHCTIASKIYIDDLPGALKIVNEILKLPMQITLESVSVIEVPKLHYTKLA